MEDSEIMTDSVITEIPEETTTSIPELIQELTEEMTTEEITSEMTVTELLTSTEITTTTTTTTTTATVCPTCSNLEEINVDMLNNFTYTGTFFIIFFILLIVFRGLNRFFRIFI